MFVPSFGPMAFFPAHECRLSSEKIGQGPKLGTNMDNLIQLGVKPDLWVEVKATEEIMMRRFLYWMLSYFLDECALEHGIEFKNKMQEWIRKAHPPATAIKYCDHEAVKLICDNGRAAEISGWRPEVSLEQGLERTIDFVRENLSMFPIDRYNV